MSVETRTILSLVLKDLMAAFRTGIWHGPGAASGCSQDARPYGHIWGMSQGRPWNAHQMPIQTCVSGTRPEVKAAPKAESAP